MSLKNKIQQNIVIPAERLSGSRTTVGQVTSSNEKSNTVSVKFIDKEGYVVNKNNVSVRLYNTAIIDWFPEVGEAVLIEHSDNNITVTSKYNGSYTSTIRSNTYLKNDILGDSNTSIISGFIL